MASITPLFSDIQSPILLYASANILSHVIYASPAQLAMGCKKFSHNHDARDLNTSIIGLSVLSDAANISSQAGRASLITHVPKGTRMLS